MTTIVEVEIDWNHISAAFDSGVPCIVKTSDGEMVRYQIATWEAGKGWRNQFRDKVNNVRHWAYITPVKDEHEF